MFSPKPGQTNLPLASVRNQLTQKIGGSYHGGLRQRWVTHLDVDTADVDRALEIVAGFRG